MPKSLRKAVPDWLAIIIASKLATTLVLLSLGFA
jgi:hypothetical protein